MRALILAAFIATSAAAQPAVLVPGKPIQGTVPAPVEELSGASQRWIREEAVRQAQAPTSLYDLELAMLTAMSHDLEKVAKRKKLSFDELSVVVLHQVVSRAAVRLDSEVRAHPDDKAVLARKAGLSSLIAELGPRMTPNSRMLTSAH